MENRNIDQIILASLQDEATANEIEMLRKWLSEDKDHRAIFESAKLYWDNSTLTVKSSDTKKAYVRLMKKSFAASSVNVIDINKNNRSIQTHRSNKFSWYKVAAALIVFFALSGLVYFIINSNQLPQEVVATTVITKQNPKGQKLTTYLPDGSKVILNSLSEIKYNKAFIGEERIVELEGEAFFEVEKDAARPFKVISNGVTTIALGTSFNVNGKNDDFVEVALVSGKVSVTNPLSKFVILDPGKSVTANQIGEMQVHDFDYLDKVGWKDGILAFDNNSLPEIINKLEDWYGVEFNVDNSLLGQFHYTGNYKNESLEEVLQGISFVHHFEFRIAGDSVEIIFNKTN